MPPYLTPPHSDITMTRSISSWKDHRFHICLSPSLDLPPEHPRLIHTGISPHHNKQQQQQPPNQTLYNLSSTTRLHISSLAHRGTPIITRTSQTTISNSCCILHTASALLRHWLLHLDFFGLSLTLGIISSRITQTWITTHNIRASIYYFAYWDTQLFFFYWILEWHWLRDMRGGCMGNRTVSPCLGGESRGAQDGMDTAIFRSANGSSTTTEWQEYHKLNFHLTGPLFLCVFYVTP